MIKSWMKIRATFNDLLTVNAMTKMVEDYFTTSYMNVEIITAYPQHDGELPVIDFKVTATEMEDIDVALYEFDKENVSYEVISEYENLDD